MARRVQVLLVAYQCTICKKWFVVGAALFDKLPGSVVFADEAHAQAAAEACEYAHIALSRSECPEGVPIQM